MQPRADLTGRGFQPRRYARFWVDGAPKGGINILEAHVSVRECRNCHRIMSQKPKRSQERRSSDLLTMCRAASGPAFVIGGWSLIPTSYEWGVGIVYLGFALCLAESIWEPELLDRAYQIQIVVVSIVICLLAVFTVRVVLIRAPIRFHTLTTDIDYSTPGVTAPAGIAWRPFFSELDLSITNPNGDNYSDVDVLVRPDLPIAAIAQLSDLPNVSFENAYGLNARVTLEEKQTNKLMMSMDLLATDAGYKIHCGVIPPNSSLTLVMAIVDVDRTEARTVQPGDTFATLPPGVSFPQAAPKHLSAEATISDKDGVFHYWYGSKENDTLFLSNPKPKPKQITVVGAYTANYRRRNVNEVVPIQWWKHDR
jgi:hypothetical protein